MRDREIEQVGHVLVVTALEPAEVSGWIRAERIRPMAVGAVLVEQAPPRGSPAGVAFVWIFGHNHRIVCRRTQDRIGETKEDGPGEGRRNDLRLEYLRAAQVRHVTTTPSSDFSLPAGRRTEHRPQGSRRISVRRYAQGSLVVS